MEELGINIADIIKGKAEDELMKVKDESFSLLKVGDCKSYQNSRCGAYGTDK